MRQILIANRGEIALRILRSARALGYRTTAIFSEADSNAPHVRLADVAVCIGPPPVSESYLNIERILDAARQSGSDAIHPGYGLLSENAAFAQACVDAGLVFIGPKPDSIRRLGNKREARLAMHAQGVPIVPGYDGEDQAPARLAEAAEQVGYPIMVKAAAGGGGRGLRRVAVPAELPEAIARAKSEAEKAFGDGRLILERAVTGARHVELQVFADAHGSIIYLGERDCSVQRRFQKVIEEAPSPALTPELRRRMGETAVTVARSADYLGAGTVEFLLSPSGEFYFLEMNTRLQVEHPVTELVTGTDLVAWQLRIAEGEALPLTQDQVQLSGHAIELRLYAEDPARGFVPQTGSVLALELPDPALVRFDHWLEPGLTITPHYDALLGKLIAHGETREVARRKLVRALEELRVLGVQTNQTFLRRILDHATFIAGLADTQFLETQFPQATPAAPEFSGLAIAAVLCVTRDRFEATYASELAGYTNCAGIRVPCALDCDDQQFQLTVEIGRDPNELEVRAGAATLRARLESSDGHRAVIALGGLRRNYDYAWSGDTLFLHTPEGALKIRDLTYAPAAKSDGPGSGRALAPMDGSVVDVLVQLGQRVERGDTVAVIEAMKLELRVAADIAGVVRAVHVRPGTQVKARQVLVEVTDA
ncbi:MAG TPA: biotin carboxylase N-terminal domain-containing protein [Polyangiales bacterium]|nr:biotin carboxylase N-terminal domain-containing protein [Polyangiales bacterium]